MARKPAEDARPDAMRQRAPVTYQRCQRLCQMVKLLAERSQTREALAKKLRVDVRGFYRDLEMVREVGVPVNLDGGRYALGEAVDAALDRLPLADPLLTLGEARTLAQGSSATHRKMHDLVERATR